MKTNFKIISFTEIEFNGIKLDLHNNFEFISANTEISYKRISLHFRKSTGDWAINAEYHNLYFILDNYNFLKQIDINPEFIEDDFCLSGITFFDNDFREEDYGLIEREVPNESDDIIFSFESERVIRVNCETLTLIAD
ncbi:hypothetical protein VB776_24060 [Arcicella sp. DC2W]|uniref:Uncharacterized protein n=1 Tax=Arcicella gelida TaxID=2984195 RepID=A0ABU5SCA1_9BACT|nr:hypothetical protein [Arcicella sp. DC2W]MEA5406035.1 hypothetical protein [Arcicella sp. DC2W]